MIESMNKWSNKKLIKRLLKHIHVGAPCLQPPDLIEIWIFALFSVQGLTPMCLKENLFL